MDFKGMFDWWDGAAKSNAMSAILSGSQDWDMGEFFATGAVWLEEHRQFSKIANVEFAGDSALDFGCGVGRMTMALRQYYNKVVGVDISKEMIKQASDLNKDKNVSFSYLKESILPFKNDEFDMVYSTIVVQHIPMPYNIVTVSEFFRVSRNLVLFDAPSHVLFGAPEPGNGIFLLPMSVVLSLADSNGFNLCAMRNFPATATQQYQYLFQRR